MKIDLFIELASPPLRGEGDRPRDLRALVDDTIALARAAEAAGIDALWLAEHHFLGDYSNASCPELLLAAIARETRRLRLGFAIVPLPIHDPIRVAERLATLDLIAPGRVLWGIGRGVSRIELAGFGVAPEQTRALMIARHRELIALLREGRFERDGESFALRPPPRPELASGWMAAVSPDSFDLAAALGLDALAGPFKPWPLVEADLRRYRRLRPEGRTSYTMAAFCGEDHHAARALAGPGVIWAYRRILEITRPLLRGEMAGYEHYRKFRWVAPLLDAVLSVPVLETLGLAAIGDPDHVTRRLNALAASGLDRVSLVLGGGDLALCDQLASLELLRERVLPRIDTADAAATAALPA